MRLFLGIAIAPPVLDNLARVLRELQPLAPIRWSPVENLHITTKFIGAWPEARLPELEAALESVPAGPAFDVTVARFGYFPNPHRPQAFFAGVEAGSSLAHLAAKMDQTLQPLGIAVEKRPYSPHLTLARIKQENLRGLRDHIAKMTNFDFGTFHASEFHLYSSKTTPNGSIYQSLATCPLLAPASIQA